MLIFLELKNTASASSNVTAQNKAAETAIRETNAVHRNVEKTSPVVEKKISSPKASASSNKKSVSSKSSAQVSSAPKKSKLLLKRQLRKDILTNGVESLHCQVGLKLVKQE